MCSRRSMKHTMWLFAILAAISLSAAASTSQQSPDPPSEAWIHSVVESISLPTRISERWDYVMNVKVRLLLFWVGADDVGGGYITKGSLQSDRSSTITELVIGSDPAKAPRKINHWGAAVEMR